MNFFKTLVETGINHVSIEVKKDNEGNITVFIVPKSTSTNEALKKLKPMFLTGPAEEIDKEFFNLVSSPLKETTQIISNIEEFESQKEELKKITAEKSAKKTTKKEDKVVEEATEKATEPAVEKVDGEKLFKEFIESVKGQDLYQHKDKFEELYALLTEAELKKPFAKKFKNDFDIAKRKHDNLIEFKRKQGFAVPEEAKKEEAVTDSNPNEVEVNAPEVVYEMGLDPIIEPKEEQKEFPNEVSVGAEEVVSQEEPSTSAVDQYMQQRESTEQPLPSETIETPAVPVAPTAPAYVEVRELVMISDRGTKEQFYAAGWDDDLLVENGYAKWETKLVLAQETPVEEPAKKIGYVFPKAFDAETEE